MPQHKDHDWSQIEAKSIKYKTKKTMTDAEMLSALAFKPDIDVGCSHSEVQLDRETSVQENINAALMIF